MAQRLNKIKAKVAIWLKDIAPGAELRRWFNQEPDKWREFQISCTNELKEKRQLLSVVRDQAAKSRVTLFMLRRMKDKTTQWFCWNFLWPVDARRIRGTPSESNKILRRATKACSRICTASEE